MVVDMVEAMVTAKVVTVDYTMVKNMVIITANTTVILTSALRRRLMLHLVPSKKILQLPKLNASSLLMISELKSHLACNNFALP